eukprot:23146-Chlamydomonas_euryale.AAC.1
MQNRQSGGGAPRWNSRPAFCPVFARRDSRSSNRSCTSNESEALARLPGSPQRHLLSRQEALRGAC